MSTLPCGPTESDIVKEGYLYIKRPPRHGFLKFKTWHKRYFVLRDESTEHSRRRLEMYLREGDVAKGCARKLVLDLENVVHVGRTADSKRFRQAFIIVCLGRSAVLLADEDSLSLNSWLLAVSLISGKGRSTVSHTNSANGQQQTSYRPLVSRRRSGDLPDCLEGVPLNQYYSEMKLEDSTSEKYEVIIQSTEASNRIDLHGEYQMMVNSWGVSLTRAGKENESIHWPLCFIRKYKNEMLGLSPKRKTTLVTLELGRRCASGEGIFKFKTQHGREIVTELTQVIAASMARKVTNDVTCQSRFSGPLSNSSQRGPWCSEEEVLSPTDCRPPSWLSTTTSDSFSSDVQPRSAMLRSNSAKVNKARESMTSSVSSSSTTSNESAEYIMATFSDATQRLHFDTRAGLRVSRSTNDISAYMSGPLGPGNPLNSDETVRQQRTARAEAEGYLEVLPDYFEGEKESEERNNIYHNMDFTSGDKTSDTSGKSSIEARNSVGEVGICSKSSPIANRRNKPPAPLPRPEHTISQNHQMSFSGRKSWNPSTPLTTPLTATLASVVGPFRRTSPPKLDWTSTPLSPLQPLISKVVTNDHRPSATSQDSSGKDEELIASDSWNSTDPVVVGEEIPLT